MSDLEMVQSILENNFGCSGNVDLEAKLDDLGFDSISFVELSSLLREKAGAVIPKREAANWTTVQSILDSISASKNAQITR